MNTDYNEQSGEVFIYLNRCELFLIHSASNGQIFKE